MPANTMGIRHVAFRSGRFVHPVYREQLRAQPPGWKYTWNHPSLSNPDDPTKLVQSQSNRFGRSREHLEAIALRVLSTGGYVHRITARVDPGTDLIHSAERLLWKAPVPYVMDLEHVELFVLYQRAAFDRAWAVHLLEKSLLDERLRFLLPWSDAARRSVLAYVSPTVAEKIQKKMLVLAPAVCAAVDKPRESRSGPLRLLFVGTKFTEKGAVEAIRAVQLARQTHNVELDIVTYAPPSWAQYLQGTPGMRLHEPGGPQVVKDLYAATDALLFPSHMDTYGVVVGEAMAHGLPVIAPNHLALSEIIRHEESGLLFPPENMLYGSDTRCVLRHALPTPRRYLDSLLRPSDHYVEGITREIVRLAEDPVLHDELAAGALTSVRTGRLSLQKRQTKLKRVYDEAADS